MPTHVLALRGKDARPSLHLVEIPGQRSRYLVLSHCYGSEETQPLCTTPGNYQSHRDGLPFYDLPKTFQDFVELARGIGMNYV
jgi:hypothetical protein